MQCVCAEIRHAAVLICQALNGLLAALAALDLPGNSSLKALDFLEVPLEVPRVLFDLPVRQRGQMLDAKVYTNHGAAVRWRHVLLLDEHRDVPMLDMF